MPDHKPRCVDLQINGYAGVDFNTDDLSAEQLHLVCEKLREDGVAGVLPTIITAEISKMVARLRRIAEICQGDPLVREVVWGLHIEGPFINETPGYVGAHPVKDVVPANVELMKQLVDAGGGLTRLVTLAPERDPGMKTVRWLADREILVSAGHCNPGMDELRAGIDAGLSMFTHLGNGCPLEMHRHENIIQRVLSLSDRLTISFIADGVHIPPPTLKNYLRLAGIDRSVVVTDAIAAARLGPGQYTLGGQTVDIGDDGIAYSEDRSHFVGSTATMPKMTTLLREQLDLSDDEIDQLTSRNPCKLLNR